MYCTQPGNEACNKCITWLVPVKTTLLSLFGYHYAQNYASIIGQGLTRGKCGCTRGNCGCTRGNCGLQGEIVVVSQGEMWLYHEQIWGYIMRGNVVVPQVDMWSYQEQKYGWNVVVLMGKCTGSWGGGIRSCIKWELYPGVLRAVPCNQLLVSCRCLLFLLSVCPLLFLTSQPAGPKITLRFPRLYIYMCVRTYHVRNNYVM